MAWKEVTYKLTGLAPLVCHSGQMADPMNKFAKSMKRISGKRNKTDADYEEMAHIEFLASLYMAKDGPVIPTDNIEAMLINAAKRVKEGPGAKAGMYCIDHARLDYAGPRDAEELWQDDRFHFLRRVKVGQASVMRMRSIFEEWSATVNLRYEDTIINVEQLDRWMQIAGMNIGLNDWRPKYGRFTASRLNGNGVG